MNLAKYTLAILCISLMFSCERMGVRTKTERKTTGIWKKEEMGSKTIMNLKPDNSFQFILIAKIPFVGEVINYESGTWMMEDSLISFTLVEGPIFRMEKGELNIEGLLNEFKLEDQQVDMTGEVVAVRRDEKLVMRSGDGQKHDWFPAEEDEFDRWKLKYDQWERK